jgi:hypothetical protein
LTANVRRRERSCSSIRNDAPLADADSSEGRAGKAAAGLDDPRGIAAESGGLFEDIPCPDAAALFAIPKLMPPGVWDERLAVSDHVEMGSIVVIDWGKLALVDV